MKTYIITTLNDVLHFARLIRIRAFIIVVLAGMETCRIIMLKCCAVVLCAVS